jgi:hypothetical protein
VSAAEEFAQDQRRCVDDIQHDDAVMRPIVLCAATLAARRRQTGIEPTVVGAKARRFALEGRLGLMEQRLVNPGRQGHGSPEAIAAPILSVQQRSPPIHDRDLVRIVPRKCGDKTHHHPVKHCLERCALPVQLALHLLALSECADA